MTRAGSLSVVADGPPEADQIARRRRGGHKTPDNIMSQPLWRAARHFGPFPASTVYERRKFRFSDIYRVFMTNYGIARLSQHAKYCFCSGKF